MKSTMAHDDAALGVTRTRDGYSALQIALHWIIAALVVLQVLNNGGMQEAWNAIEDGETVPEGTLGFAWFHALTGATILVLALIRLYVRLTRGALRSITTSPRCWCGSPTPPTSSFMPSSF